ncbi:sulfatase-like hydrolase/transferase [Halomonas denitrificans]|uniref:sulfatase-like hydrolase/transferase n=1 Tax=Halomonas denitrificans TaxID=370769 RepID=UPI0013002D58|nr:sulfatase-like hydrolase/transferase [Halomonas denitrificans]
MRSFSLMFRRAAILAAAAFLPNIILLAAAEYYSLIRPVVNLDYLLTMSVFVLGWWHLGVLLVSVAFLADIFALIGQVFPFFRLEEVVYLSKFFLLAPLYYKVVAAGVFCSAVVLLALHFYMAPKISRRGFFLTMVLFGSCYFSASQLSDGRSTYRKPEKFFAASQFDYLISSRQVGFASNVRTGKSDFSNYVGVRAITQWSDRDDETLGDQLLFVIVESWGVPHKPEIQEDILRPLRALRGLSYDSGIFQFSGATVEGELRELCGLRPSGYDVRLIPDEISRDCLPRKLSSLGYSTAAMHGASSTMYDRGVWYPKIGFDEVTFFEDRSWPRRCFSFPGACDVDMVDDVEDFFVENDKGFFYWLTLNSHSPYDARDISVDRFDCEKHQITSAEACRNLKLNAQFFDSLAKLLSQDGMQDVDVVVVGDHEPRLFDREEFEDHFESRVVPWIMLQSGKS